MSEGWTINEAAEQLHPPLSAAEVRALILVCDIPALGTRRSGGRGRPAPEYDQSAILRAHAAVVTLRPGARPTSTAEDHAAKEIAQREPDPIEGRIMAPGDAYRGRFAGWEAPADAIPINCPHTDPCGWRQYWDTAEECRTAQIDHLREAHDHPAPHTLAHDLWGRW